MDMNYLYRAVIMEHYKNPLNKGLISDKDYLLIHMNNPSCGDELDVQLKIEENIITDIRHEGKGCSICCSSASVMSDTLKGETINNALLIMDNFYNLVMGKQIDENILKGDALAYGGVSKFPARIKCATLAWKAVEAGINSIKNKDGDK